MNHAPPSPLFFEALGQHHERGSFCCGVEELDRYLRQQAGQDMRRKVAVVFVLVERASGAVLGFYTLANTGIALASLPPEMARKLPRYPLLPATLLGRLAVHLERRGQGLGQLLVIDALKRSLQASREVASFAVVVDPKNEAAQNFYQRLGFLPLTANSSRLYLPMKTVERVIASL